MRIIAGATLVQLEEEDDYPSRQTIYLWKLSNPEFARKLEVARAARNENLIEECLALGTKAETLPGTFSNGIKLSIDTKFRAIEAFKSAQRARDAKEPNPEDAKTIDGDVKRLDTDPLYASFLAFEASKKAANQ